MFRRVIFSGFTLTIAAAAVWYAHIRQTPEDRLLYDKLVQTSQELRSKSALEKAPIHQSRTGVRKDLWTLRDNVRRHAFVQSRVSELTLSQKKEKIQAIECVEGIEGLLSDGPSSFHHLSAEKGILNLPSFALATIELEGNVRLNMDIEGQESFALADFGLFSMEQKELVLKSTPPSRVLFSQAGLELSAPIIHIQDTIRGAGDIRLLFDPEEKQLVNRLRKP